MGALTKINGKWVPVNSFCKRNGKWMPHGLNYWKEGGEWNVPKIYGFRINQAEPDPYKRVVYTNDAVGFTPMTADSPGSWAGCPLIKDIKPVLRKADGTWQDLDKRNLSNGADITTLGNDVLTEFREWWLSIKEEGGYNYIRFSNEKLDPSYNKLGSLFEGVDRGCFHIGDFHGYRSNNQIYSSSGKIPTGNISITEGIIQTQNRDYGFDMTNWHQVTYLRALFTLLFKTTDSKSALGEGYTNLSNKSQSAENITSFSNDYGMHYASGDKDHVSFFWINDWWGNVWEMIGGAKVDSARRLMLQQNGELFSLNNGYVNKGVVASTAGWVSKMHLLSTHKSFVPAEIKGSDTTYYATRCGANANSYCKISAGYGYPNGNAYFTAFDVSASTKHPAFGVRLSYRAGRPGVEPI